VRGIFGPVSFTVDALLRSMPVNSQPVSFPATPAIVRHAKSCLNRDGYVAIELSDASSRYSCEYGVYLVLLPRYQRLVAIDIDACNSPPVSVPTLL
jgi:hypothetical protein